MPAPLRPALVTRARPFMSLRARTTTDSDADPLIAMTIMSLACGTFVDAYCSQAGQSKIRLPSTPNRIATHRGVNQRLSI